MGAADVVPGVSGGTIAFITGIYEELLESLSSLGIKTVRTLFSDGIAAAWKQCNGNFLLALFAGVLLSIFTLAKVISLGLEHYPIVVWAFFFGLILASVLPLSRKMGKWVWRDWVALVLGLLLAFAVSELRPTEVSPTPLNLFLGGCIAICAMILPGISGAFILLIVGLYPDVLEAVHNFDLGKLIFVGLGAITGLMLFSRVLVWLLHHFHNVTLAFLVGILIGSLKIVWPWKLASAGGGEGEGARVELMSNVPPWVFATETGQPSYLVAACAAALVGATLVILIEKLGYDSAGQTGSQNV